MPNAPDPGAVVLRFTPISPEGLLHRAESGFEDVRGPMPVAGQKVLVREPEENLVAIGVVERLDENDRLVYVAVDWAQLAPDKL